MPTNNNKIELAIFDLGNVVFKVDWQPMFDYWAEVSGVDAKVLQSRFSFDEGFAGFERGEISGEEFHKFLSKKLEANFNYEQFVKGWNSIYQDKVTDVEEVLKSLKDKLKVVAFTNTNSVHSQIWPTRYADVLKHFEHVFSSSECGFNKPNHDGFIFILNKYNVKPKNAIFFDDLKANIESAKALGLQAVLVDSDLKVREALSSLNIL